jgi:hypothetical protein
VSRLTATVGAYVRHAPELHNRRVWRSGVAGYDRLNAGGIATELGGRTDIALRLRQTRANLSTTELWRRRRNPLQPYAPPGTTVGREIIRGIAGHL